MLENKINIEIHHDDPNIDNALKKYWEYNKTTGLFKYSIDQIKKEHDLHTDIPKLSLRFVNASVRFTRCVKCNTAITEFIEVRKDLTKKIRACSRNKYPSLTCDVCKEKELQATFLNRKAEKIPERKPEPLKRNTIEKQIKAKIFPNIHKSKLNNQPDFSGKAVIETPFAFKQGDVVSIGLWQEEGTRNFRIKINPLIFNYYEK